MGRLKQAGVRDDRGWFECNEVYTYTYIYIDIYTYTWWMSIRNRKDWLHNCLQYKQEQFLRMQIRPGASLNMEPVTFILPVFPAWSFSQYHDLQGVFIHASSASPLDALLPGQHLVLHGRATAKRTGERGDYERLTSKAGDGSKALSFSDRSSGASACLDINAQKASHHGVFNREGKHHIGQQTLEEKKKDN